MIYFKENQLLKINSIYVLIQTFNIKNNSNYGFNQDKNVIKSFPVKYYLNISKE